MANSIRNDCRKCGSLGVKPNQWWCTSCQKAYYADHKVERQLYVKRNSEKIKVVRREYVRKYRKKFNAINAAYTATLRGQYFAMRARAKFRKIKWDLTLEEFANFWQVPCYYTGRPIEKIGLDRIDSSKGYSINNVVSCHPDVNTAKNNLSQEEFFKLCQEVVNKRNGKLYT